MTARRCEDQVDCNGVETCDELADRCAEGQVTCVDPLLCDTKTDGCVSGCPDCTIDRTCVAANATKLGNPCLVCDPDRDRNGWSHNDGVSCGNADDTQCTQPDSCLGGGCRSNHVANGTNCGTGPEECSAQDTCDGNGVCAPNHRATSVTCGVAATACRNASNCDGSGACGAVSFRSSDVACDADGNPRTVDHCSGSDASCVMGADYCTTNRCWAVPPTGQTHCYNETVEITCPGSAGGSACATTSFCGQDAQVTDPARTFTCKASGGTDKSCAGAAAATDMVVDSRSQLWWQREGPSDYAAACGGATQYCTFSKATSYCNDVTYGGYSDWRMPDLFELLSITHYNLPALPGSDYPGDLTKTLWSSTMSPVTGTEAYVMTPAYPSPIMSTLDNDTPIRCVRSGPSGPRNGANRFTQLGTMQPTTYDRATGLEWTRRGEYGTWSQALSLCEGLDYAGHTDWHLPNHQQAFSLMNLDENINPSTDFPGIEIMPYWSSTTLVSIPTRAFVADFDHGHFAAYTKTSTVEGILCVRGN
ncbi:MAG: DUF1566 domain-containing protein [Myxococcales bacterium]